MTKAAIRLFLALVVVVGMCATRSLVICVPPAHRPAVTNVYADQAYGMYNNAVLGVR
jgi:hypothetical protein